MLFVLKPSHRRAALPIEEKPVPKPTSPAKNSHPRTLLILGAVNATAIDFAHLNGSACETKLRSLRYEGMFTPPSLNGTLQFPAPWRVNWGSMSSTRNQHALRQHQRSAYEIRLIPQVTFMQIVGRFPRSASPSQRSSSPQR